MRMFAQVAMAMAALGHAVKAPIMPGLGPVNVNAPPEPKHGAPQKRYTSSRKSQGVKNGGRAKPAIKGKRHRSLRSRANRRKAA